MIPVKEVGVGYIKVILFLIIGLTFGSIEATYDEYLNKFQLPENVYPMHYKVKLTVNTESSYPTHVGHVHIDIRILSVTPVLILNAKNLKIHNFGSWLITDQGLIVVDSHKVEGENLAIYFNKPVQPGKHTLSIKFESTSEYNFYQSQFYGGTTFEKDNRLILTQFGKLAARQLFPCWDDPVFKATFDIGVKHSKNYTALSNMPSSIRYNDEYDNDTAMMWSEFDITPMMSTHQLVIVLMPSTVTPNSQVSSFYTWCKSNTTITIPFAHYIANKVPNHLQRYTDIPAGIPKIGHVVIWDIQHSESRWGLIIHRESKVMYNKAKDAPYVKMNVAVSIAFQVARQWFGGLITNFETHPWLCKSFATFLSHYAVDQIHKEWFQIYFMVVENLQSLLHIEDNSYMPPVLFSETESHTDILMQFIYHKGSVLLRMLQHIMGEEVFRKGVIIFLNRHKYGMVTTDNLWSAMQAALNATSESKVDIKKVMDSWITQRGYPLVNVTRDYVTGKTIISQKAYNTYDDDSRTIAISYAWWIPVSWTKESSTAFHETSPTLWLGPKNETISITTNPDEWIIINLQQTGYYRVHYDRTNWEKIGNYLKNDDYSSIHVLNRAQIIDDICNSFKLGYIDWALFSLVTSYLSRETNYIPWIPMINCLDDLSMFFLLPEGIQFQMHFVNYFDGILNEIGYEEDPTNLNDDDFTRKARHNVAIYACFYGNPTCRNAAGDKLTMYLADPTGFQILPWWKNWTFCYGLKTTHTTIWYEMLRLYLERKDKTILNYLVCTEHIPVVIDFLYIIVRNKTLIEDKDLPDLINTVIKHHIHNNQLFSYILQELTLLKSISANYIFDKVIENLYSMEKLDELLQFIRIFTNDFAYDNKIEQRRQQIRALQKTFNRTFFNYTNEYDKFNYLIA